jgi:hypothetical protein
LSLLLLLFLHAVIVAAMNVHPLGAASAADGHIECAAAAGCLRLQPGVARCITMPDDYLMHCDINGSPMLKCQRKGTAKGSEVFALAGQ